MIAHDISDDDMKWLAADHILSNQSVQGSAEVLDYGGHAALHKSLVARSALPGRVWGNQAMIV